MHSTPAITTIASPKLACASPGGCASGTKHLALTQLPEPHVVLLYISAKSAGTDLELINFGKKIRQLLAMTNLLSVLAAIGEQGITII